MQRKSMWYKVYVQSVQTHSRSVKAAYNELLMHFNSLQSLIVITRISVNALKRVKFSLKRRLYNR